METTSTKVDVVKPILLKAGISLAMTVAGFIFARITTRKCSNLELSSAENQRGESCLHEFESIDSSSSSSSSCVEDDHSDTSQQKTEEELQHQHIKELEEEILALRSGVEDLHARELELQKQYLHYHDMKEQEIELMELQNKLLLEIARVEFLEREISSMEAERQRFENMAVEYLKLLELLEISRSRNRLLQRRVKKLLRKAKKYCMQNEAKEAEISRNHQELDGKADIVRKLADEIEELKTALTQLQLEKNELLSQLELANAAASSKIDTEEATKGDYGQVVSKLEQLEKQQAMEAKELIYLRWCNACLRHELMRKNQEQEELGQQKNQMELNLGEILDFGSDNELENSTFEHGDSCLHLPTTGHARAHLKRSKFIEKFKRWVEGSEKTKQRKGEKEKSRRHSVLDGSNDLHNPVRNSYSSA
ncbi:hypothetical protein ACH5RR_005540 [Cinchona calisaya]|uniref:Protein CHUP1, chloroplastic n=1 Tax=Cinchona calisaya TaxID=153742 RepID=A0ABD3ALG5_9GENT